MRIQLLNTSTALSPDRLASITAATQTQITRDFAPAWGISATLTATTKDNGDIPIHVVDTDADAPPDALAWHTVDNRNRPYGIIPMKVILADGADAGPTIGHEVLELMADPLCNKTSIGPRPNSKVGHAWWSFEDCDPVENDSYAIGSEQVTNFVLPSWFQAGSKGPWDHMGKLHAPFTLTSGGYAQYTLNGRSWKQIVKNELAQHRVSPSIHCRKARRIRALAKLLGLLAA